MDNRLFGFCVGLGIGVACGILFAPKSGADTRSMIRDRAGEGADYLKRKGIEMRDKASEFSRKGAESITRQGDAVRAAVQAGKEAYTQAAAHS